MFNLLDVAPPEPTVTETIVDPVVIIGLVIFVLILITTTVIMLKTKKNK